MSKKRRRSFPSLFNPFGLFRMGNASTSARIDEKSDDPDDNINTIYNNSNSLSQDKFKNNTQIQFLSAHSGPVRHLCKISSTKFASCSDDCLILIWCAASGCLLDVLTGHQKSINQLLFVKYKLYNLLISSSNDNTIRIWNINNNNNNNKCIQILNNHNSSISKIILYKKQKQKNNINNYYGLISASNNGQIGIWSFNQNYNNNNSDDNDVGGSGINNKMDDDNKMDDIVILLRMISIHSGTSGSGSGSSPRSRSSSKLNKLHKLSSITEMLILNGNNIGTQQLIIGCQNGSIIFINLSKNDKIKLISKHISSIKYIYQLSIDRFITASYDGLICVWRIESHFPQLLDRINDPTPISTFGKLQPDTALNMVTDNNKKNKKNKKKNAHAVNTTTSGSNVGIKIISPSHLKLNCFISFIDSYLDKYFIVSFFNSFVIFDSKLAVKVIVRNIYNNNTEIISMTTIKNNQTLITANNKNIIKLFNLTKLKLKTIQTSLWLSDFRELLLSSNSNKLTNVSTTTSTHINDLCVDVNKLLINTFSFHSDTITCMKNINQYTFITSDKMNQIILWKDAYTVSYQQNKTIKKYYNLPNS